jgi:hypothetical protein
MAEIRVEPKNNNNRSIWPWIIGALLLIGLVWGISRYTGDDNQDREATRTENTMMDNGEARPVEPERVRNDRFEEDRFENDRSMENDRMMQEENSELRNDRIEADSVQ